MTVISIGPTWYGQLMDHLWASSEEQVAFMRARWNEEDGLEVVGLDLLGDDDIEHHRFEVRLRDHVRPRLIKAAWDAGVALVEAHSHGGPFAASFSPTDMVGLREWVPHLRWRLGGRPYAALVFARDSVDGLVWRASNEPDGLSALLVGECTLTPTGRSIQDWRR